MRSMTTLAFALLLAASGIAAARNTIVNIPIKSVLEMPEAKGKLNGSVRFYLKGQATPQVVTRFGDVVTNPKTNGFNKSDLRGCMWATLSALVSLQSRVALVGQNANAVVDIVSYYKKHEHVSSTDVECHAGALIAGVALKGTLAKVAN